MLIQEKSGLIDTPNLTPNISLKTNHWINTLSSLCEADMKQHTAYILRKSSHSVPVFNQNEQKNSGNALPEGFLGWLYKTQRMDQNWNKEKVYLDHEALTQTQPKEQ